ncbi:MAG TPA: protein kinase [Gemmatimonadaceae bacterium]|nr:protein kinase [Gemmatimonadaceae bacterium]
MSDAAHGPPDAGPHMQGVAGELQQALGEAYVLERELGRGGMATVYLAHDARHDRPVALKVLRDADAPIDVERFQREIRVLARLRHPFILPLYDSGEAAGSLFFVMPYIDGESLRTRLEREGHLPVEDALEIVRQLLDALHTAHDEGIVHRDIKPENVLLARSGHALLADFGIARAALASAQGATITQVGVTLGTVAYMSPEQAMGEREIDARSDLYALGCMLFEMLTGAPPFTGNPMSVLSRHLTAIPPDVRSLCPGIPATVAAAVAQSLAKDPGERPASARDLARALADGSGTSGEIRTIPQQSSALRRGATAARLSMAVLPIVTIGAGGDDDYFGDGLTEELTSALSRLEGLRVVSRTSASSFRGQNLPLTEIAARLGVEFVVEGSVRRAGRRLRLAAKLIQASDDAPLWSETFDRTMEDVFAVQDEITASIVETVTRALQLGGLRGQVPVPATHNLGAYDLYLLGRHQVNQRSEASLRRARELFQQAIDLDPAYAPAWSGLADASALFATSIFALPAEMFPVAAEAARRAIELDSSLADAHASLGLVKLHWDWDWAGALDELHRAIALNPNLESAHRWLSAYLAGIGRFDEAMPIAERALLLDPLSVLPRMNIGIIRNQANDLPGAERDFRRVLTMQPEYRTGLVYLGVTLALQGRCDEALQVVEKLASFGIDSPHYRWPVGLCHALAGRTALAHEILDPVHRSSFPAVYRAMSHVALGERDAALATLEQGIADRSSAMYTIGCQPLLRALHGDPRFEAVLAKLALPKAGRAC